ncbi:maltose permease MAL61 [Purpureocillium lavendulum]|uniref:Maltose permease MAL61 n=1 Tax=Purpureocillium lavendulum TaxID=1247861 RepID=A0AB34FDV3_9HYPO|nr:maltose permease MAL61 [Purpureocillium lavendulum]KAJ6436851.1 maltose permease MAL61 [Purpureocillium lavendulum]
MEGYDTALLGNFFAYPEFAKKFGSYDPTTETYQVPARWQAGLGNAAGVGAFFGAMLNGLLVDRFGQKMVLLCSLVALSAFIFIVFFATDVTMLLVGEILCGFPWGIFATSSPAYSSEVLPLSLRVYLTSWTNMCFVIGQLLASGVLAGMSTNTSPWAFRVPFAIQWIWPAFLFPILLFAPESPWHLVRKGRIEDARKSLKQLNDLDSDDIESELSLIIHTNDQEEELLKTNISYWDCFKGVDARRTEIACVAFLGQVTTGPWFAAQGTYFFQQVGLTTDQTYHLNIGGNALGLFFCIISWIFIIPNFGRRTIYLSGTALMAIILFVIAILNIRTNVKSVGMTQAVLTLVWTCAFQATIGQIGWALPAEVSSTRLRQKTIVLARNTYYIGSVIASVLQPYFMNPTAWNLKGYTGFFWGGTALLTLIWAFFRLPETKGRSFEELFVLFANRVPTRQFKDYQIDVFDTTEGEKGDAIHVDQAKV